MSETRPTEPVMQAPLGSETIGVINNQSPVVTEKWGNRKRRKAQNTGEELSRLRKAKELELEVKSRLTEIAAEKELERLLNASAEVTQLADAMSAIEAFIRNSTL